MVAPSYLNNVKAVLAKVNHNVLSLFQQSLIAEVGLLGASLLPVDVPTERSLGIITVKVTVTQ